MWPTTLAQGPPFTLVSDKEVALADVSCNHVDGLAQETDDDAGEGEEKEAADVLGVEQQEPLA
jgi:hypothetical protein